MTDEQIIEAIARAMVPRHLGMHPDDPMPNDGPRWGYYAEMATAALAVARKHSDTRIAELEAENVRLREILAMCADDLEEEIEARRAGELPRRIERDLHTVRLARAALRGGA
jgi:hypothetical protein